MSSSPRSIRKTRALASLLAMGVGVACNGAVPTDSSATTDSLDITPNSTILTIAQGRSAKVTYTITRKGPDSGPVLFSLAQSGTLVGAAISNVQTVGAGVTTGDITIYADTAARAGTYTFSAYATGPGPGSTTITSNTVTIGVTVIQGFNMAVTPFNPAVAQGGSTTITATKYGTVTPVALSVTTLPVGVTVTLPPPLSGPAGTSGAVTFTAGATAPPGTYFIGLIGSDPSGVVSSDTTAIQLTIAGTGFSFSTAPISVVNVAPGGVANVTITVNRLPPNSTLPYTGDIALFATGVPTGLNFSFSPSSTISNPATTATMILTAAGSLAPGSYPITISLTGSNPVTPAQTVNLTVIVSAPATLDCTQPDIDGASHSGTITSPQTWAAGVHHLNGNFVVGANGVLTIQPGALVCMGLSASLQTSGGGWVAIGGASAAVVTFRGDLVGTLTVDWQGIVLQGVGTRTSTINNAVLESPDQGIENDDLHPVNIAGTVIRNTKHSALTLKATGSTFVNSTVEGSQDADPSKGAVRLGDATARPSGAILFQGRVRNARTLGVDVLGSGVSLSNCEVTGSGGIGVFTENQGLGVTSGLTIGNCNLTGNTGLAVSNGVGPSAPINANGNWWGTAIAPVPGASTPNGASLYVTVAGALAAAVILPF